MGAIMPARSNRVPKPRRAPWSDAARQAEMALRLQCLKLGNAFQAGCASNTKFEAACEIYDWVTAPAPPSTAERRRAAGQPKPQPDALAKGLAQMLAALVRQRGGLPAPLKPLPPLQPIAPLRPLAAFPGPGR